MLINLSNMSTLRVILCVSLYAIALSGVRNFENNYVRTLIHAAMPLSGLTARRGVPESSRTVRQYPPKIGMKPS